MNDLKFAFRQLLKNPGFTGVALLTLALGIGANTAIFSVVNAILLRPLPYKNPKQLVMLYESHSVDASHKVPVAAPMLGEWRRQTTVFEGLAAQAGDSFILTGRGQPESLSGTRVSANMFSLLGVQPMLGRDFLPEEEIFGRHHVALLSYELWQRRFGGDTSLIGQSISINSEPYTVVGVAPPRTFFPDGHIQLWTPLAFSPDRLRWRHSHNFLVYGRLKTGITLGQAQAEMDLISQHMAAADSESKDWGAEVYSYHELLVGNSRRILLVLLGAVGLVLLIGCANIANLLLARSSARAREFAIRAALGAGRRQIVRQLLIENFVLAALGGLTGVFLALLGLKLLPRLAPPDLPRIAEGVTLDGSALGFTSVIVLAVGIFFGLAPALQAANPSLATELTESARSSAGRRRQGLRNTLAMAEVALSLMLLVGAGLLIRSLARVVAQPTGFSAKHVVTMQLSLPDRKYPDQADRERFFSELHDRVKTIPGVESASLVMGLPLSGDDSGLAVWIPGATSAPGDALAAGYAQVSPDYFRTLRIPLIEGRDFTDHDRTNTPPVLIVDETFAREFKLGANVLGKRIRIGDSVEHAEIIGVVRDVRREGIEKRPRGEMYRSYRQLCWGSMRLAVRTQRDPAEIIRTIRIELDGIDKDQPLENVRTMTQLVASNLANRRWSVQLLGGFAGAALLLAAIGLYGVLAYNVTQRTREIGIRMALGAQKQNVLSLVIGHGLKLTLAGVAVGVGGALVLTRVMQRLLFEVEPTDPLTFICVSIFLLSIGLVACWLPARHAAKVDPMEALRYE